MSTQETQPISLPKGFVIFLQIAIFLSSLILLDVVLPKKTEEVIITHRYTLKAGNTRNGGTKLKVIEFSSGRSIRFGGYTALPLYVGQKVTSCTSRIFRKVVAIENTKGKRYQRKLSLYNYLVIIPLLLIVTALITLRHRDRARKAIHPLWIFCALFIAMTLLILYPS